MIRPGIRPGAAAAVSAAAHSQRNPLWGMIDPSGWETFHDFRFASGADASLLTNLGTAGSFAFGDGSATLSAGGLNMTAGVGYHAWLWYPGGDANRTLDFTAAYHPYIAAGYQPSITKIRATVSAVGASGGVKIELKDASAVSQYAPAATTVSAPGTVEWTPTGTLTGIKEFLLLVDSSADITFSKIEFYVEWAAPIRLLDFALAATLNQLLGCYDSATGKMRDKKDLAVDQLDNPSAGGLLCLACVAAVDAGLMSTTDCDAVIDAVAAWLVACPKSATAGIPAHFITSGAIAAGSEYGTIDAAIAFLGAAIAASARSRATALTNVETLIDAISFPSVIDGSSYLTHGRSDADVILASRWDYFGGEAMLPMILAAYQDPVTYASRFPMAQDQPPVYGSRGFIGEIGALFCEEMASGTDSAAVDWGSMRSTLLALQRASVAAPLGGLSEAEYLTSNGALTYEALEVTPVLDHTVGGESRFAATDYRLMAGERDSVMVGRAVQWAREKGLLTTLGGMAQSFKHDGALTVAANGINWRVSAIRSAFSFLGLYGAKIRLDGGTHAIRAAAAALTRFQDAIDAQF